MKRLIVGITGSSGVIYGIRLLEVLKRPDVEAHLIISDVGRKNILLETDYAVEAVEALAHKAYRPDQMDAAISSGSFRTDGMVIAPCTMKTLSAVANSYNDNLIARAADVCLKERRSLVLVVRETPLHKGHLELMAKVADLGGIILPPMPAFYHRPKTVEEIIDHTVGKVLDLLGIDNRLFKRWE
jgi:flavin prenyltransferase